MAWQIASMAAPPLLAAGQCAGRAWSSVAPMACAHRVATSWFPRAVPAADNCGWGAATRKCAAGASARANKRDSPRARLTVTGMAQSAADADATAERTRADLWASFMYRSVGGLATAAATAEVAAACSRNLAAQGACFHAVSTESLAPLLATATGRIWNGDATRPARSCVALVGASMPAGQKALARRATARRRRVASKTSVSLAPAAASTLHAFEGTRRTTGLR